MGTAQQVNSYQRMAPFVEIMDSTLRDGEQTNGVSFLPHEKLVMARKLLYDVNVDRIEVASARVSEGEREAVTSPKDKETAVRLCGQLKSMKASKRVWLRPRIMPCPWLEERLLFTPP